MTNSGRHLYEFGPFRLSETEGVLSREGQALPLTRKALDLLLVLVKGAGKVLTKEELIKTVWAGIVVGESNLPTQIATLRKAIGDGYVETVPTRGYRFTAAVTEIWEEAASTTSQEGSLAPSIDAAKGELVQVKVTGRAGLSTRRWYFGVLLAALVVAGCALIGLAFRDHAPGARPTLEHSASGRLFARATSERGSARELKLDHVATELLITPDGKKLYALEYPSRTITVLDSSSLRVKGVLTLPSATSCAAMTRDGKRIYVGSLVEGVTVVDTERDRVLDRAFPTGGPVYGLAVTPDEKKLFLAMEAAGLKRISTVTGESKVISGIACPVSVGIDPDGSKLYVSYQCGGPGGRFGHDSVEIYDVNSERTLATVNGPPIVGAALSFAPHEPYVFLPGKDACSNPAYDHEGCPSVPGNVYHLLRSTDSKIVKTFTVPGEEKSGVFAPDGNRIIFSGDSLLVWDPLKDKSLEGYAHIGERYGKAALTPSGDRAFIPVFPTGILVLDTLDPECLPPAQGLFNLYSGDGTLDDERQTQSLVAEGGLEFAPGLIGQAFHFNGKDSILRARRWGACDACVESWSESLYVKFNALEGRMAILERTRSEHDPELRLLKSADNRIVLEAGDRSKPGPVVATSAPIGAGDWHHLAVVTADGDRLLYVDGVMIGRIQKSQISPTPRSRDAIGAYVGATRDGAQPLNGLVDELAFYNRALSASEIKGMYELTLHRPCSLASAR